MKNCNSPKNRTARRFLLIACATALAGAFTVAVQHPAHADPVTPPPVPDNVKVPPGATAFLVGHATGTQNYVCSPCPNPTTPPGTKCPASGFAFMLFTPEATLFGDNEKQVITHYFSPNLNPIPPEVEGTIRATWQDSHDTSTVWAAASAMATHATDPQFVKAGAVAWLLLPVVGSQSGPIGSNKLGPTTFIQRVNTSGGLAPSTGCDSLADVGREAFQPYTADYFFYTGGESN